MMALNLSNSQPARWQPTELVNTLLSPGARQVIRCWLGPSGFLDDHHHPRMLLSLINEPGSFPDLVHAANANLVPAVVLNELLRKGIVETLESGHILLRRSAYAPSGQQGSQPPEDVEDTFGFNPPRRRFNDI